MERKNDVAGKVTASVLAALILVILMMSNTKADSAFTKACEAESVNMVQDEKISNYKEDMDELKVGQNEIKTILLNR